MDKDRTSGSSKRRKRNRKKKSNNKNINDVAVAGQDENSLISNKGTELPLKLSEDPDIEVETSNLSAKLHQDGLESLSDSCCDAGCTSVRKPVSQTSNVVEALASQSFETLLGRTCEGNLTSGGLPRGDNLTSAASSDLAASEEKTIVDHCFSHLISESVDLLAIALPSGSGVISDATSSISKDTRATSVSDSTDSSINLLRNEEAMHKMKNKQAKEGVLSDTNVANKQKHSERTNEPNKQKHSEPEKASKDNTPDEIIVAKTRKEERKMEYLKMKMKNDAQTPTSDPKKATDAASKQKTKSELKAERRALQEAQRAAKGVQNENSTATAVVQQTPALPISKTSEVEETPKIVQKSAVAPSGTRLSVEVQKVQFFSHLQQYKGNHRQFSPEVPFATAKMHPSIVQLGLQYAEGIIVGSNARCVAFLFALKQVVASYTTPPKKELSRDLEDHLNSCVSYLQGCRPLSVSMENAAKFLKYNVTQMTQVSDSHAKEELNKTIDSYIEENIRLADKAIAEYAMTKIVDNGDEILTFGHSSVIASVLIAAKNLGKQLHVTVVDSQPNMEGKKMITTLVKQGIKCSYTLINSLSYTMQKATKVFLGAHALLANGYVMSRVGSSQVALVAKAYNVPVLICCETYKFSERMQTDSFVHNELRNPDDLRQRHSCHKDHLQDWESVASLNLLNLAYDVTPPELVSVVVTELGMLPCTSVPVVLRVRNPKGTM